ncbi:hypothetical protein EV715DRAFT_265793 [Schizophyllum commune]
MTHSLGYAALAGPAGRVLTSALGATARFITCFKKLKLSQTQWEEVFDSRHSIMGLAIHLYVGCLTAPGLPAHFHRASADNGELQVAEVVKDCTSSLWLTIVDTKPGATENQVMAAILAELKGHPRRMLRAMGRGTSFLLMPDPPQPLLQLHLDTVSRVTGCLRRVYSRVLIKGMLAVIKDFSDDARMWSRACTALSYMCVHNAHALLLMVKFGGLPIIDAILKSGSHTPIPDVLRMSLVFPDAAKAIGSALNGSPVMTSADMNSLYGPTRRATKLLHDTKRRWGYEARCSNLQCVVVGGASLRACACARVVYCSRECQKLHWRNGHRDDCIVDDGNVTLWPGHKGEIYRLAEPRIMVATSVCRTDVEYDLTFTFRPTWAEQPRFRSLTEGTLENQTGWMAVAGQNISFHRKLGRQRDFCRRVFLRYAGEVLNAVLGTPHEVTGNSERQTASTAPPSIEYSCRIPPL